MPLYRTYIIGRADHFWGAPKISNAPTIKRPSKKCSRLWMAVTSSFGNDAVLSCGNPSANVWHFDIVPSPEDLASSTLLSRMPRPFARYDMLRSIAFPRSVARHSRGHL
jgi:hypothetical protein